MSTEIKKDTKWKRVLPKELAGEIITITKVVGSLIHFNGDRALRKDRFLEKFEPVITIIDLKEIYG